MRKVFKNVMEVFKRETVATIAALIAALALFVAIWSGYIARAAYDLSEKQYAEERTIILKTTTSSIRALALSPVDSSMTIMDGRVYFPRELFPDAAPIDSSGVVEATGTVELNASEYLKKLANVGEGKMAIIPRWRIPIAVDTYYSSKGGTYEDRSIYFLDALVGVPGDTSEANIKIVGLVLWKHLEDISDSSPPEVEKLFQEEDASLRKGRQKTSRSSSK